MRDTSKPVTVLIVDDSAVVRQTLTQILESDPQIQVIGQAQDPFVAAEKLKTLIPDVITLDVEMPRMDGITFLRKLMTQHPIPVVMCSSLTGEGTETALRALEYGAVEIITKPRMGTKQFLEESRIRICDAVKAAAFTNVRHRLPTRQSSPAATGSSTPSASVTPAIPGSAVAKVAPKLTADAMLPPPDPNSRAMSQTTEKLIIVGASTGGTEALRVFLEALPADAPGIVIVQHMPENFTRAFADRLNTLCQITVKEAADNDSVVRGRALIAPGNKHTMLKRS
ncbi:MAG: chemotaxis-specific protein-glutamate methyltransferase CheB, partial [Magnetococcales bacterium]|nr:chemotaxis-specific protein-glutamate methyltransferase CheB [Magnetococcales bacterium]